MASFILSCLSFSLSLFVLNFGKEKKEGQKNMTDQGKVSTISVLHFSFTILIFHFSFAVKCFERSRCQKAILCD